MDNKTNSRIKNTSRNIASGIVNRLVAILLPFINRTALLWLLGAEFTGLNGLFSSILQVLNIAELGFHTAVVYSLYEPIAKKNEEEINEKLALLRTVYHYVGLVVFGLGAAIMPFLPRLIKGSYPDGINLYGIFALYLLNSGISYFLFAYKETLLIADQRQDIANNIRTLVNILKNILELSAILLFRNIYAFVVVAIFGTVLTNLLINRVVTQRYPFLKEVRCKISIPPEMRRRVSGLLIDRICDTFRNSFDSTIISATLGLVAIAIYGNYYYIYSALYGIMLVVCNAMGASVGNSIVIRGEKENYENMLDFSMIFSWILGWSAITMACLYQPFMFLWAGESMMLPVSDMLLFVLYYYIINMNNIRNQYVSGTGIWWELKHSYLLEAFANLTLNIILGKLLGITGVLLATIITIFLFNYLQRNRVLFKYYFRNESIGVFYRQQFFYLGAACVALALTYFLCIRISPAYTAASIAVRLFVCLVVPNLVFAAVYRLSSRWNSSVSFLRRVAARGFKKE